MNYTKNGRYHRYRTSDQGELQKRCNGPLHPSGGAFLPLRSFWVHKSGPRKGKPLSQCQECEKIKRGRHPRQSGLIKVEDVWFVFQELQNRLGKAETIRRLHVSQNFWMRAEKGIYRNMRRTTAVKGVKLLAQVRRDNEVRHRDSIKHGAKSRGREERVPVRQSDLYRPTGDNENYTRKMKWLEGTRAS